MKSSECRCPCGEVFDAGPGGKPAVHCPACGRLVWYRTRTNLTREEFERMVEAACDTLADGNPPFSGAR